MDTTEKQIRDMFCNSGPFDRDEIALLMLQLVERIQNLEQAPQRQWVGLEQKDMPDGEDAMFDHPFFIAGMVYADKTLKEKNHG